MKVVFDIDNTLYSFAETGFGDYMHDKIVEYIVDRLKMEPEAAKKLGNEYYAKYGLAALGLHKFHDVDLVEYCRFVNSCDYSRLTRSEELIQLLQNLKDAGHDLWIMTNADMPHAHSVLDALDIKHFFVDAATSELRGYDCFLQWDQSEPKMQNKPQRGAYEALHRMLDPSIPHNDVVMIDDAIANLEAPSHLGWRTVWISHGNDLPSTTTFKPDVIVKNIFELPASPEFVAMSSTTA
jgi:pyrimidine 5'-nucleotidase